MKNLLPGFNFLPNKICSTFTHKKSIALTSLLFLTKGKKYPCFKNVSPIKATTTVLSV